MRKRITKSNETDYNSQRKKSKHDLANTYFFVCLQESGLTVKRAPEKCIANSETVSIIRNIKKNVQNHYDYPRNISTLFSDFEKDCDDIEVFKHYLFPNIIRLSIDNAEEHTINDSVVRILLNVPLLQTKVTDYVFEKAIDLGAQNICSPWIQMILKCFTSLDSIVSTEKVANNLINLLAITSEKMVRLEIITALPDIIGDQHHDNVALELSKFLNEDNELIPAVLDCLSYLCLSDDEYQNLQRKTLNALMTLTKCSYFPNFVKFLLMPGRLSEQGYLEIIQGLRDTLDWPMDITNSHEVATSQVLTASAVRNSIIYSKIISNAWLKAISACKIAADHKPFDFVVLLIVYSISEDKQRQVDNLIRKQIKINVLKENLILEYFQKYKPILKEYIQQLIDLTNSLLKSKTDPIIESYASSIYTLMFSELNECRQRIVAELLQLGLDRKQCLINTLQILSKIADKDMAMLKPQSLQMLTLLDRTDDVSLNEIREIMNLICGLAYTYENSIIRDDVHMIIRKELGSSSPAIKIHGVLAGVNAVKYLMATKDGEDDDIEKPDDISYSSVTHLPEGPVKDAAQIMELIACSTKRFPDMIAFFYDELSTIISSSKYINKHFLSWLSDAVTNDLQVNFIVDSNPYDQIGHLTVNMQYCLNEDDEMDEVIAINIAGLTLQSKSDVNVGVLSPLFQLTSSIQSKLNDGDLSSIDALLGCAVLMPKFDFDLVEELEFSDVHKILDCLIHCVNWFRELLNGFSTQNDETLKVKIMSRLQQIYEMEELISQILLKVNSFYKPPICSFDVSKYLGDTIEQSTKVKLKTKKQKVPTRNESILPKTAKSQCTQNTVRGTIDVIHNLPFRTLNLNLLYLCNNRLSSSDKNNSDLNVKNLNFILKCVNHNLSTVLISRIKRNTFLTKIHTNVYDPSKAEACANNVNNYLQSITTHIDCVTEYIENFDNNTTQTQGGFNLSSELVDYLTCLEYLYAFLNIYFKWIGFQNHNNTLLKKSLMSLLVGKENNLKTNLKDLFLSVADKLKNHSKYCMQLSTAVSLLDLLKSIQDLSHNEKVLKFLRDISSHFLSVEWKTPDGVLEKGLLYNQSIDKISAIYFMNNEIVELKQLLLQITDQIKNLKNKNDTLQLFKCFNKSNFPILYRHLGSSIHEAAKRKIDKGLTDRQHLELWKDVTSIMICMSEIVKVLETRNTVSAYFKKCIPIIKLFTSQGVPMVEMCIKSNTEEVLEMLRSLQQTTRFLQTLCCHSQLKLDTSLIAKVPNVRHMLETLIYKVKAALASNNLSEAFWMGNLKNKTIQGEVIPSQQSVDEESTEDCDDQLPSDDEIEESDDDLINPESNSISDVI